MAPPARIFDFSLSDRPDNPRAQQWLPPLLALGAPALVVGLVLAKSMAVLAGELFFGDPLTDGWGWLDGERGVIELVTVVVLLPAVALSLAAAHRAWSARDGLLTLWLGVHALGAFYFAGEEISWGQHLFAWEAGEWFAGVNDQKETNLHNISSWLDQKPRSLLLLWVILGGIAWPLVEGRRGLLTPHGLPGQVLPTRVLMPAALMAVLVRLPHYLADALRLPAGSLARRTLEPLNLTEAQELLFAVFILLYAMLLFRRLRGTNA